MTISKLLFIMTPIALYALSAAAAANPDLTPMFDSLTAILETDGLRPQQKTAQMDDIYRQEQTALDFAVKTNHCHAGEDIPYQALIFLEVLVWEESARIIKDAAWPIFDRAISQQNKSHLGLVAIINHIRKGFPSSGGIIQKIALVAKSHLEQKLHKRIQESTHNSIRKKITAFSPSDYVRFKTQAYDVLSDSLDPLPFTMERFWWVKKEVRNKISSKIKRYMRQKFTQAPDLNDATAIDNFLDELEPLFHFAYLMLQAEASTTIDFKILTNAYRSRQFQDFVVKNPDLKQFIADERTLTQGNARKYLLYRQLSLMLFHPDESQQLALTLCRAGRIKSKSVCQSSLRLMPKELIRELVLNFLWEKQGSPQ